MRVARVSAGNLMVPLDELSTNGILVGDRALPCADEASSTLGVGAV
eukprot:CAMPEP_0116870746 /NCGR_PEP_ID=MMETSP0463-20121206/801_1 /TAXON_ID=181622 /ORGANISM="Strombidinopsis sp, Strain SopsisLIS2011" /LENGTH=45 /DNA_ID= /DNA_START= /DNA_END= /DNA_ORIENTATION=